MKSAFASSVFFLITLHASYSTKNVIFLPASFFEIFLFA